MSHREDRDPRPADPGRVRLLEGRLTSDCGPPSSGPRYLLRPSVEAFVDRHGALCFVRPGEDDLVVREPSAADLELVRHLQRGADTARALARASGIEPTIVQDKLDSLVAAGLVLTRDAGPPAPLTRAEAERFSRQLPYLAELGEATELQRRIRDSSVTVLGCGGLGTWVIATLACLGVGRMVLVDDDRVALSNLNRQILYTMGDLGTAKVGAAGNWVREFDPAIELETIPNRIAAESDVPPLIAGADVVMLAADWPPYEIGHWVNAACVDARIPFVVAGQVPPLIKAGPMYVPGQGPCFACHEAALARDSEAYEDYVAFRSSHPATASTIGPASCIAGGLVALDVLHLLLGQPAVTQGTALLMHMGTLEVRRETVRRSPGCPACKHLS